MDVQMFVTTVGVHRQTGGSLAHAGTHGGRDARTTYLPAADQGHDGRRPMSAMLVASAGPLLFLYFSYEARVYPSYAERSVGADLLLSAVVLEIVGVVWILSLMRTEN